MTFDGGSASRILQAEELVPADNIAFALDGASAGLLAFNLAVGSRVPFIQGLGDGFLSFYKDSVSEAGSLTRGAGYVALPGFSFLLEKLEASP